MHNYYRSFVLNVFIVLAVVIFGCKNNSNQADENAALVSRGPVIASFKCPGSVHSANVVSVVNTLRNTVTEIYKVPGSKVEKGELILQLDKTPILEEISSLKNQIQQKENALERIQLNANSVRLDLNHSEDAKKARVQHLKHSLGQQQKLLEAGGTTQERVDQVKQNLFLAEQDLNNQAEKNSLRLQQLKMDELNLELQIQSMKKSLQTQQAILQKTNVKAPVSGILLEVAGNVGNYVSLDQALVKIADKNTLKIVGTAGRNKLALLEPGGEVEVLIQSKKFSGTVGEVFAEENSEMISFDVFVAENEQHKLAGVEDVELLVKANDKENVLRMRKFPGMALTKHLDVLLQRGEEVIRTEIVLGTFGKDYCEIISGAQEGDIILRENPSDTSDL